MKKTQRNPDLVGIGLCREGVALAHLSRQSGEPHWGRIDYFPALYQRQHNHETAAHLYSDILKLNPGMGIWWVGMGISLDAIHYPIN